MGKEKEQQVMMVVPASMQGLRCLAQYAGSTFRVWDSKDKKQEGRMRTNRLLKHRFIWTTANGEECLYVDEWVNEVAASLADCTINWVKGQWYDLALTESKTEAGVCSGRVNPALSKAVEVSA